MALHGAALLRRWILAASLAAAFTPPCARAGGFQLDIDGVAAFPRGDIGEGRDRIELNDLLDNGGGARVAGLFTLGDSLAIGGQLGVYLSPVSDRFDHVGDEDYLASVPVHAVVQFNSSTSSTVSFWARGGIGFTHHAFEVDEEDEFDDAFTQNSFSFQAGGGLAFRVGRRWAVTTGIEYHQAFTDEGEVWFEDNDPRFLLVSVGLRFRTR